MRTTKITLFISLLVFLGFNACSSEAKHDEISMSVADEEVTMGTQYDEQSVNYDMRMAESSSKSTVQFTPPVLLQHNEAEFIPTSAASSLNDGNKKFIRTANLRFEVRNVLLASKKIEDIIIRNKGFIINSTVRNNDLYENEQRVSKDSILVTNKRQAQSTLKLRVHHSLLDTTLRALAPLALNVEFRSVVASEVTFDILANKLEQSREKDKSNRIKNLSRNKIGSRLDDLLDAEEAIHKARKKADDATVEEYKLADEIEYSTIDITLWEQPIQTKTMKLREAEIKEYETIFFHKLGDSLLCGWAMLLVLITSIVTIWPILLIVGIVVYGVIHFRNKKKIKE